MLQYKNHEAHEENRSARRKLIKFSSSLFVFVRFDLFVVFVAL